MPGGQHVFAAAEVLTAANVNSFLMNQAVIQCTSITRPSAPPAGMTIYQTDTNTFAVYGTAWCEVTPYSATVATRETTTSATYVALTTASSVTVTTGTKALVTLDCVCDNASNAANNYMSFAVTGATTVAAADARASLYQANGTNGDATPMMRTFLVTGLTAGANTFSTQFRTSAGGGTGFQNRDITVVGIPT